MPLWGVPMQFSAAYRPVPSTKTTSRANRPDGVSRRLPLIAVSLATFIMICEQPSAIAQQFQAPQFQAPQFQASQYVQPVPNYVSQAQNKPTPYQYPQPAPQDRSNQDQYRASGQDQGAGYGVAPGPDANQPQYADAPPVDAQGGYGAQQPYGQPELQQGAPQQGDASQGQPFAADQLAQLVAPIALYPDNLVAQILAAATYPAQVAAADNWLRSMGNASPDQVAAAASGQTTWDPSVKALTAFPQVLAMMDHDLQWTTDLGNAYYNQPQDVLQTVQVMRQRAQSAGNLQSGSQETVSDNQGYIQVAPANPQVVYVPTYNPWMVYGAPVAPYPGFSLFNAFGAVASVLGVGLRWGAGIGLAAFSATPFGWAGWALNWLASSIFFNHSPYYSHSMSVAHWGGPRGGGYYGNRFGGGINRTPRGYEQGFNRMGNSYGDRGFNRLGDRAGQNYAYNRGAEGMNRGFDNRGYAARPEAGHYAMNRGFSQPAARPAMPVRPQGFAGQSNAGRGGYGAGQQSFARQAPYGGQGYGAQSAYGRAAAGGYAHNQLAQRASADPRSFEQRSYGGSFGGGRSYSAPRGESFRSGGGSHGFGGGHQSFKAPKAPKMSGGGGHHSGGGHSSHHGR
jgi:hypothetical protein